MVKKRFYAWGVTNYAGCDRVYAWGNTQEEAINKLRLDNVITGVTIHGVMDYGHDYNR